MKILLLTEQFPWPLTDGGNLRTWHIIQGLQRQHEVTVLAHHWPPRAGKLDQSPCGISRPVLVPKLDVSRRLWHNIRHLGPSRWPLFLLKNFSPTLLGEADRLLASESFDVIHFNHLDTACFALTRDWPQPMVFDTHNCLTSLARQMAGAGANPVRRWFFRREAALIEEAERRITARMALNLVCSSADAGHFMGIQPQGLYEVVPNGVDREHFQASAASPADPATLVFTGAMSYYPNVQAAIYFQREILPLLKRSGRPLRTLFVGRDPAPQVRRLHDGERVIVTGSVPDVRPYLEQAAVVIVPLLHGSGTRLKILEAFSMGKAVVSTRVGAEGLGVQNGKQLLLADEPRAFADCILRLLDDEGLRQRMGLAARQLVEAEYAWPVVQDRLNRAYSQLCSTPAVETSAAI